jgi:hypothetical protein
MAFLHLRQSRLGGKLHKAGVLSRPETQEVPPMAA